MVEKLELAQNEKQNKLSDIQDKKTLDAGMIIFYQYLINK